MGVDLIFFDLMCRTARETQGGAACSAGYPDMLVSEAVMAQALGPGVLASIPLREDAAAIKAWHGVGKLFDRIYDSAGIFKALGYELDVIDIHPVRGGEIIVDLNHPLPADFSRTYDLVLDTGVCEHCFNIGQAALNLASLVKKGGFIVQGLPLNMYNHGFYNINPTWYHDFYSANGFEIVFLEGAVDWLTAPKFFELPAFNRFHDAPPNSGIYIAAVRREVKAIRFPVQRKYQTNPGLGS